MSRFGKLSHVIWHCQYHIVWVPKYRYRILTEKVGFETARSIRIHAERLGCELVELNVRPDHVHLLVKVPPKVSISKLMGIVKGRTALQIFKQFTYLKEKPSKRACLVRPSRAHSKPRSMNVDFYFMGIS